MQDNSSDPTAGRLQEIRRELRDAILAFSAQLSVGERALAASLIDGLVRETELGGPASGDRAEAIAPGPAALRSYLGDLPQTGFDGSPDFHRPIERIMPRHADIASAQFPSLRDLIGAGKRNHRVLDVCIVTPDIDGPIRNGGIGTAYRHVAEFLRDAGHNVTILYTLGEYCEQNTIGHWVSRFAESGITLVPLPQPKIPSASGRMASALARPRAAYEWLKDKPFHIVHTTEWKGASYVALSAKRLGLAFKDTLFLVKASSPTMWGMSGDARPMESVDTLMTTYMERKSIEYADVVISPSRHMLRWMMRHGYDLPKERCFVHPNIMPMPAGAAAHTKGRRVPVNEIVFFGRFEPRKGIHIFLHALDLLGAALSGLKVTFLGKPSQKFLFAGALRDKRGAWPFSVNVIDDKDSAAAIEYLKGEGRLAVMPSLLDNSPFTVFECLTWQVPFLTSDRGGGPELIHEEDRAAVLFDCIPSELAAKIEAVLRDGALVARPSFDGKANLAAWREAHLAFAEPEVQERYGSRQAHPTWNGVAPVMRKTGDRPLVSVCIPHFNRPRQLAQAIESIHAQSYRNIELIVVDDGSSLPEAKSYLDQLEAEWATTKEGRLLRQSNRYPGAARNRGVSTTSGEFILLMDDDNLAKPDEIETFLRVADYSGADILCCYSDTFSGTGSPWDGDQKHERLTPLGDAVSLGLFFNCFGDANCFVRRRVFDELGGFTEDYGIGLEDQEFFARAVLRGFKFRVLPEALNWYRLSSARVRDRHFNRTSGDLRVLTAYMDNIPLSLHEALRVAQGQRPPAASMWFAAGDGDARSSVPLPLWKVPFVRIAGHLAFKRDVLLIRSSGLFDVSYYLNSNPDVAKSGVDPIEHFLRFGAKEGRKPNPNFDPGRYLDDHPDAAVKRVNPLVHFVRSGGVG